MSALSRSTAYRARTLLLVLALLAAGAAGAWAQARQGATEQEVTEALTCQCGCNLTVANCNHPSCSFAVPLREQIDAMLKRGMGRVEIIAYFRAKYGEKILSAPTTHGFNLLAWVMPFVGLAAGCALVMFTIGRWRARESSAPASPRPVERFDARLREELARELRDTV